MIDSILRAIATIAVLALASGASPTSALADEGGPSGHAERAQVDHGSDRANRSHDAHTLRSLSERNQRLKARLRDRLVVPTAIASVGTRRTLRSQLLLIRRSNEALVRQLRRTPACRWRSTYTITAYGPPWNTVEGGPLTATGVRLDRPKFVIAVDPSRIALGSKVRIWPNPHNTRQTFAAEDTGGAIIGAKADVFDWRGRSHQNAWGVRQAKICVL